VSVIVSIEFICLNKVLSNSHSCSDREILFEFLHVFYFFSEALAI
jgi:hypothetical protein